MKKRDRMAGLGIARVIGASALLVAGGVHLEQYIVAHYSVIPTIGRLFLVNFIAATTLGLLLLIPIGRPSRRRLLVGAVDMQRERIHHGVNIRKTHERQ